MKPKSCTTRLLKRLGDIQVQAVMTMNIKTYSELITLPTFEERFCYLKLDGSVGKETFGSVSYTHLDVYKRQW